MFTWPQRALIRTSSTNILSLMMTTNNFFSTWITITHSYLAGESNYPQGKFSSHTGQEILVISTGCSFPLFFFFKLFDSLFSASNLFQIISSIIRLVWMITHHFSLSPAPCAFRFSTFLQLARSNTWSLKPATTTEFTNLYFITNHSFSAAFDIWATCSSQLKFTFAVLLLQPAHFKHHCPGVPCSILHLT